MLEILLVRMLEDIDFPGSSNALRLCIMLVAMIGTRHGPLSGKPGVLDRAHIGRRFKISLIFLYFNSVTFGLFNTHSCVHNKIMHSLKFQITRTENIFQLEIFIHNV